MAAARPVENAPQDPASADDAVTGTDLREIERRLERRVQEIVSHIETAKAENTAAGPHEISTQDIRAVAGQLDAVGREAERAAGAFLDAAEQLDSIANQLPDGTSGEVQKIATRIFEASNFHDITGQRITQAMRVLRQIESKLEILAGALNNDVLAAPTNDAPAAAATGSKSTEPPLDGPDPDQKVNLQDDIDALFDKLD